MSRIGKMPIAVPAGVDVKIADNLVTVKGPKGELAKQESMLRELCEPYGCRDVILTSAENGFGIDALKAAVEAAIAGE